jgi:hypothetical protein
VDVMQANALGERAPSARRGTVSRGLKPIRTLDGPSRRSTAYFSGSY